MGSYETSKVGWVISAGLNEMGQSAVVHEGLLVQQLCSHQPAGVTTSAVVTDRLLGRDEGRGSYETSMGNFVTGVLQFAKYFVHSAPYVSEGCIE